MASDLAIDFNTGDLILSPHHDVARRVGVDTVQQRIRVRLRVRQGEWPLDPTGGSLGSRLFEALRYPQWRAESEVPLIVREALAPMDDIIVDDVQVSISGPRSIKVVILFSMVEPGGLPNPLQQQASVTLNAGG
jgi:phage gp46-like protein